jgi:hypothetical protein
VTVSSGVKPTKVHSASSGFSPGSSRPSTRASRTPVCASQTSPVSPAPVATKRPSRETSSFKTRRPSARHETPLPLNISRDW